MTTVAGKSTFTPVCEYLIPDVRNTLVMLQDASFHWEGFKADRANRAYKQLLAVTQKLPGRKYDDVADLHIKMALNKAMRYAELALECNLSRYESILTQYGRNCLSEETFIAMDMLREDGSEKALLLLDQITSILELQEKAAFEPTSSVYLEIALRNAIRRVELLTRTVEEAPII
ncbi:hypothetical protein ACI2KR_08255 [Pseudomonas luteola]